MLRVNLREISPSRAAATDDGTSIASIGGGGDSRQNVRRNAKSIVSPREEGRSIRRKNCLPPSGLRSARSSFAKKNLVLRRDVGFNFASRHARSPVLQSGLSAPVGSTDGFIISHVFLFLFFGLLRGTLSRL